MKRSVVDALQPFGNAEADHGHKQVDYCGKVVEQNRKTRQRDHQCHCGKNFQFSWSLKNHMESEHEGKDVCCTHCNKMFVNPINLKKHLSQRICQGGGGGRFLSTPLKQVEPRVMDSDLGEDIQEPWVTAEVEQQSRKTTCPHCGKKFMRMGNLQNHMEKQTCLKAYALPAIEEPLEIIIEDSYSALSLTRPEVPMMTRAEEGLHCFWEEDTGLEVLLVQVESGGKLFWAEPLKEAEFLRAAAGGLVMALEEAGFANGGVLMEEEGVMTLEGGFVAAMEEDDGLG